MNNKINFFKKYNKVIFFIILTFCFIKNMQSSVYVYAEGLPYLDIVKEATTPQENSFAVKQLLLLSVLTLIPSLLLMLTPFVRIGIVFSIMRQSLGLSQSPPNQVLLAISLFMTIIAMSPTLSKLNTEAIQPYMNDEITIEQALDSGNKTIREYMFSKVGESELSMFINLDAEMNSTEIPKTYSEVSNTLLFPAYMVTEIKAGIFIGIIISIVFTLIDLATASILMGIQMMMLSPQVISVVFKMMLFIFVNGFELIIQATMLSLK